MQGFERISLEKIILFVDLLRSGSITALSRISNVPLYKIQNDIKSIEKSVNRSIFVRKRKQVQLTEFGNIYAQVAFGIYERYLQLCTTTRPATEELLLISATNGVSKLYLPNIIAKFINTHPGYHFRVLTWQESDSNYLCDVTIGAYIEKRADLEQVELKTFSYKLYASDAYLEYYGEPKNLADLMNHRFLLFKNCYPFPGKIDVSSLNVILEGSSYDLLVGLAKKGLGIVSLVDTEENLGVYNHNLRAVLPELLSEQETIVLSYSRNSCKRDIILEFLNIAKEVVNNNRLQ